jgi:hypothetical protein
MIASMAIVQVERSAGLSERVGLKATASKTAKKAAKKGAKKSAPNGAKKSAKKSAGLALDKRTALEHAEKHPGKKAAKHVGEKTAKHAGKKAAKHAEQDRSLAGEPGQERESGKLVKAFHHLERAAAVISLIEEEAADLKTLMAFGIAAYQRASEKGAPGKLARQALSLLKAIEHLAMAGLYAARVEFRVQVDAPGAHKVEKRMRELRPRLEGMGVPAGDDAQNLLGLAWELLRRADASGDDPHLEWELAMAAEGLCDALEEGF